MYMKNLGQVQTKLKAVQPLGSTLQAHADILKLRNDLSAKIRQLFDHMTKTYHELLQ
jgi:hypothetical protein